MRDKGRAQEKKTVAREMMLLSEYANLWYVREMVEINQLDLADGWSSLLSVTLAFPLFLGRGRIRNPVFVENNISNLAFPLWFIRWQFPCHWTWSLGLKYSQHVKALQAVTVAMTSPPSNFLLFWSWGGEQQEASGGEIFLATVVMWFKERQLSSLVILKVCKVYLLMEQTKVHWVRTGAKRRQCTGVSLSPAITPLLPPTNHHKNVLF